MKKQIIVYFLTENINPEKEKNEIDYLKRMATVVVVSDKKIIPSSKDVNYIHLPENSDKIKRASTIWSKICYLCSRIGNSQSDKRFDLRNLYTGNEFTRAIVNLIWRLKVVRIINSSLPNYDTMYFVPFKIFLWFKNRKAKNANFIRIVVHDALILRVLPFSSFIVQAKIWGWPTFGIVKSWDNPFYSQFCTSADGYLVWSTSMWQDIQRVHSIGPRFVHIWGARPFYLYYHAAKKYVDLISQRSTERQSFNIGYAAAFCDELMGKYEIAVIEKIANLLLHSIPNAIICVRPYPILPAEFYHSLENHPNVKVLGIVGPADVYTDGNKHYEYRRGSEIERCDYLANCDCFLSIATSFTFEAAIFGTPIVNFRLTQNECNDESEREFFMRLAISDHLYYFTENLPTAASYQQLMYIINELKHSPKKFESKSTQLLNNIGIPTSNGGWDLQSEKLAYEMRIIGASIRGNTN